LSRRGLDFRSSRRPNWQLTPAEQFLSPPDINGLNMWLRSDVFVPVQGVVIATGTTPPTVTVAGTPSSLSNSIEIDITAPGTLGVAVFSWKLNGSVKQTLQVTSASFPLSGTGITATFSAGTYAADNVYKSVVTVSTWTDLSGKGNSMVQLTTPAEQPSVNVADPTYNGRNTIVFTNAGLTSMSNAMNLSQPFTVFCVGECNDSSAADGFCGSSVGSGGILYQTTPAQDYRIYAGTNLTSSAAVSSKVAMAGMFSGASSLAYLNMSSSPVASGAAGASPITGYGLGGASGAPAGLTGKIAEVLVYSGALTTANVSSIFKYFASLYAISAS
jgi:hypothetical protein